MLEMEAYVMNTDSNRMNAFYGHSCPYPSSEWLKKVESSRNVPYDIEVGYSTQHQNDVFDMNKFAYYYFKRTFSTFS